ncbi:hypothetical protein M501DRAFT_1013643 [Patellaria atrata CBS 101060]|uniref:BTB domain-containing protein n=1 Tax=Patellaria atrata CBS 101060 TaxID=1346257 RepID=A0A9P4SGW7_9PEZI|nr:hypothetical protein M501DRAFT_1013643 [Patellaria atrata CBS 101060]
MGSIHNSRITVLMSVCELQKIGPRVDGPTLDIYVIDNPEPIVMHRALIAASSKFFEAVLNGHWKESEGIVRIPYAEKIGLENDLACEGRGYCRSVQLDRLTELYVLEDVLIDIRFKNRVIDGFIHYFRSNNRYPTTLAKYIYGKTFEGSPMRRLLVDFYGHRRLFSSNTDNDPTFSDNDFDMAPREFLVDLLQRIGGKQDLPEFKARLPWTADKCGNYHEHNDEQSFCRS